MRTTAATIEYLLLFSSISIATISPSTEQSTRPSGLRILQGNDDGWAESNIRALYKVLTQRGHQTAISAPVRNKSGTGSISTDWKPLAKPGEYDSVPVGAPGVGEDPEDPRIWYVNAFPVDGIRFGLDTLAPRLYNRKPDLILTGPNVGKNTGVQDPFSGTLGAAAYGSRQGVPAIAISADDGNRHSYENVLPDDPSEIYANATMRVIDELVKPNTMEGPSYLPEGCVLNINLQKAGPQTNCKSANDYKFALTTIFGIHHSSGFTHCGSQVLPGEQAVLETHLGCWASVTIIQAGKFIDGSSAQKQFLLNRAPEFFSCPVVSQVEESSEDPSIIDQGIDLILKAHQSQNLNI